MALTGEEPISAANLRAALAASKTFEEMTWRELAAAAAGAEDDAEAFEGRFGCFVGKSRDVEIEGYGTFGFTCVAVCADTLASGRPAGFTFACDGIVGARRANATASTSGGWASCELRQWLDGTLLPRLPSGLREAVRAVSKQNTAGYGASPTTDRLWVPSQSEVGLGGSEGAAYPGIDGAWRVRGGDWWLRTVASARAFRRVAEDGSMLAATANASYGVVPCFCL